MDESMQIWIEAGLSRWPLMLAHGYVGDVSA